MPRYLGIMPGKKMGLVALRSDPHATPVTCLATRNHVSDQFIAFRVVALTVASVISLMDPIGFRNDSTMSFQQNT